MGRGGAFLVDGVPFLQGYEFFVTDPSENVNPWPRKIRQRFLDSSLIVVGFTKSYVFTYIKVTISIQADQPGWLLLQKSEGD